MLNTRHTRLLLAAVLALAAMLLSACAPFVDQDQPVGDPALTVTLAPGGEVGQTFVAQHGGLNGVTLALQNGADRTTTVEAHLRAAPDAQPDLAVATVVLPPRAEFATYNLVFPTLTDSHGQYLYVALRADGEVRLQAGPAPTYLNGSLYRDGQPVEGQLLFRLTYDAGSAFGELLRACLDALRILGAGILAWVLPGWALLTLGLPVAARRGLSVPAKIALAAGIGVSLYPVLMVWAGAVGLRLGNGLYWGPVVVSALLLGWQAWRNRGEWRSLQRDSIRVSAIRPSLPTLLLLVAGLALFVARLLVVRGLEGPSWGDSVQHAAMTQLIFDHGGLFSSWQPYAPYQSLSVQFGFAAAAAVVMHWLGLSAAQATLITGQLFSGLAVLCIVPLALRIARGNAWAGVVAVIVAGLLSPMPGFYVNWGRYAQLSGQVVLPIALWLLWEVAEQPSFSVRTVALAALALAGMVLSYYRMPYYYAAFVLCWLLLWALPAWRGNVRSWASGMGRLAAVAAGGALLFAPWLTRIMGSTVATNMELGMTVAMPLSGVIADYQAWRNVADFVPLPLLIAAGLALLWALIRRNGRIVLVALWVAVMASLVAGRLINLPGANLMQSFAVLILLYLPLGLVLGWFGGEIAAALARRLGPAGQALAAVALVVLVLAGLRTQMTMVKSGYVMVTRPDTRAMTWIADHTPGDAVFLAEGFRIYEGASAVGADAGWWIPLLARRANTIPPQYALLNEEPNAPDYSQRVVDLVATLERAAPGSDEGLAALCGMGVTHVYVGQTTGQTGFGVKQLFSPTALLNDPHFALIYHRDRVYIFAVTSQTCDVWSKTAM